jgi:hypothetical protein
MQPEENTVTAKDIYPMTKAQLVELIEENELDIDHKSIKSVAALKQAVLDVLGFEAEEAATEKNIYTYIGAGADSPRVIKLMGKQKFVRGEATEVTDPELLAKLPGITTFVKGTADQETLHRIDEEGRAEEVEKRASDALAEQRYLKSLAKLKA